MMFFDPNNKPISLDQWRETYRACYFLGGPTHRQKLNQSSRYVEGEIERLLNRPCEQLLTFDDLKLIMAWKVGQVDHRQSDNDKTITFRPSWRDQLISQGQYGKADFSKGINYLAQNMAKLQGKPAKAIFDLLPAWKSQLPNFGAVYWLTVIYFITTGEWPIFDKFAWIAAEAISTDATLDTPIPYPFDSRSLGWTDYLDYVGRIKRIFGRQNIGRQDDQALWVYGHFFDHHSTPMSQKHARKVDASTRPHIPLTATRGRRIIVQRRTTEEGSMREIEVKISLEKGWGNAKKYWLYFDKRDSDVLPGHMEEIDLDIAGNIYTGPLSSDSAGRRYLLTNLQSPRGQTDCTTLCLRMGWEHFQRLRFEVVQPRKLYKYVGSYP